MDPSVANEGEPCRVDVCVAGQCGSGSEGAGLPGRSEAADSKATQGEVNKTPASSFSLQDTFRNLTTRFERKNMKATGTQ